MQDQPNAASLDGLDSPTAMQDLRDQRVVLTHVLTLHPTYLVVPQLVQEIGGGIEEFAEGDALERAVRDLTGLGLLQCPSGLVMPTHAAIRFDALLGG
ncbi:MAG: hypothetical protein WDZ46_03410 [Solirubrobacterales bacterium]